MYRRSNYFAERHIYRHVTFTVTGWRGHGKHRVEVEAWGIRKAFDVVSAFGAQARNAGVRAFVEWVCQRKGGE